MAGSLLNIYFCQGNLIPLIYIYKFIGEEISEMSSGKESLAEKSRVDRELRKVGGSTIS